MYFFYGIFISEDDVGSYGPYDTFGDAAEAVGLFNKTAATTRIWVHPNFHELSAPPDASQRDSTNNSEAPTELIVHLPDDEVSEEQLMYEERLAREREFERVRRMTRR